MARALRLFEPIQLKSVQLMNRAVVAPMCMYSAKNGVMSEWHKLHLGGLALGGFGLVFVEATGVEPRGRISPQCTGLWDDATEEAMRDDKALEGGKVVDSLKDVSSGIEKAASDVVDQMGLYLENPTTQSILLKPVSRKLTKALGEVQKTIAVIPDESNGWDESLRGDAVLLLDEIGQKVKRCVKASR